MRRFRFHLGTIVILVLLLAVGLAALRECNEIWDSSIFSITLGVLLNSNLLAIHRTEERRAFWLGSALFGWIYLGHTPVPTIESRLITTRALTFLDTKMPRTAPASVALYDLLIANNSQPFAININKGTGIDPDVNFFDESSPSMNPNIPVKPPLTGSSGTAEHFVKIGHSHFAVVAAILGGQISRHLYTKNPKVTSGHAPARASTTSNSGV